MSVNLMKWLKNPLPLRPLYLVIGTEAFFISEIKKTFIKNIFKEEGAKDFNYNEVSVGELPVEDILNLYETLPLVADKRLLFCNRADKFSDKDWEKFKPTLSSPNESTVLVYFFEKKDSRKKHFKLLKDKTLELSAQFLKAWELSPWLDFVFQQENLEFSYEAKTLFQQLMGTNLMEIHMEIKKLKQYSPEGKKISQKDVLACASRLKIDSVFDLTAAIGNKNMVQALNFLAKLLEQNQNEIGALALLARHIRILSKIKEGKKQKLSKAQLAHKAGVSPYFLQNYLKQSELWSDKQIHQTMEALFSTDKALKSSPLSSHIWLENFILKTCS